MKSRDFDARRLDVRAFAEAGGELRGQWSAASFERLREAMAEPAESAPVAPVRWHARGFEIAGHGGASQVRLHLQAEAALPLVCQRCLEPCIHVLTLERLFLFVAGEAEAAELDAALEHDVLVFSRELDLHQLLEDELLLDLPLVPRHDACREPLLPLVHEPAAAEREHPFAALASLRRGGA